MFTKTLKTGLKLDFRFSHFRGFYNVILLKMYSKKTAIDKIIEIIIKQKSLKTK